MANMSAGENLSDGRPKTNGSVVSAIRRFQNVMKNSSPTKKKKIVTAFDRLTRSGENSHNKKNRVFSTSDHSTSTKNTLESKNQSKKDTKDEDQNQKRDKDQDHYQERDKDAGQNLNQNHDQEKDKDHDQEIHMDQDQEYDEGEDEDQDQNADWNGDRDDIESQNNFQEAESRELFADNPLFRAISRIDTNNNTVKSLLDTKVTETTSLIPLLSGTITTTNSFPNYGSPNHSENNAEFHDIEMVLPSDADITVNKTNGVLKPKCLIWMVVIITTVLSVVAVYLYFAL